MRNDATFLGVGTITFLVTAFILVQPVVQKAYSVGIEGVPDYDDCTLRDPQPEAPTSMNSVRRADIVKTIYIEKEIFDCTLDATAEPVVVDVTTYIEIYENIDDMDILDTFAIATVCLKQIMPPQTLDCQSYDVRKGITFVAGECTEETGITDPQQANTLKKANIVKTIEAQKEVFTCTLPDGTIKKVDIILFTEVYEDLSAREVIKVQFLEARCFVLVTDMDELTDATVESCRFTEIPN